MAEGMFEGLKDVYRLTHQQNENIQIQNQVKLIPPKDVKQPQKQVGWKSGRPNMTISKKSPLFSRFQIGENDDPRKFSLMTTLDGLNGPCALSGLKGAKCIQFYNEQLGIIYVALYSNGELCALASSANLFQVYKKRTTPSTEKHIRAFAWALTGNDINPSELRLMYGVYQFKQPAGIAQTHPVVSIKTLNKILTRNGCLRYRVSKNGTIDYRVTDVFADGSGNGDIYISKTIRGVTAFLISNKMMTFEQLVEINAGL